MYISATKDPSCYRGISLRATWYLLHFGWKESLSGREPHQYTSYVHTRFRIWHRLTRDEVDTLGFILHADSAHQLSRFVETKLEAILYDYQNEIRDTTDNPKVVVWLGEVERISSRLVRVDRPFPKTTRLDDFRSPRRTPFVFHKPSAILFITILIRLIV